MKPLRAGEILAMQYAQESSLGDWYVIGVLTETAGTDGGLSSSYVDGSPKLGSLFNPSATQSYKNQMNIEKCDAVLRVEKPTNIHQGDRVTLISTRLDVFYVQAEPINFRTTKIVLLSRVRP